MYRERRINRTWAMPKDWEVDTTLVEDLTLLFIWVQGEYDTTILSLHGHRLLPYMRRWGGMQVTAGELPGVVVAPIRDAHQRERSRHLLVPLLPGEPV